MWDVESIRFWSDICLESVACVPGEGATMLGVIFWDSGIPSAGCLRFSSFQFSVSWLHSKTDEITLENRFRLSASSLLILLGGNTAWKLQLTRCKSASKDYPLKDMVIAPGFSSIQEDTSYMIRISRRKQPARMPKSTEMPVAPLRIILSCVSMGISWDRFHQVENEEQKKS